MVEVSVICPFYNEEQIIEAATRLMLKNLQETMSCEWELILVNDGSKDASFSLAKSIESEADGKLRVTGYAHNKGRGAAISYGIEQATGKYVVTTEADCSWGGDVARRILDVFHESPATDVVIASPNAPGGGYKNVPFNRVLVSRLGNKVLRLAVSRSLTMFTGMTRGYKRTSFLRLPIDEPEKEFHLDVIKKALAFGYNVKEIPAVLEWQDARLTKMPEKAARKSSSKIKKLILTHLMFSLSAAPLRFILLACMLSMFVGTGFLIAAFYAFFWAGTPASIYLFTSFFIYLFGFLTLVAAAIAAQLTAVQEQLWKLRSRDIVDQDDSQKK